MSLNAASEAWQTEQRGLTEQVDIWFRNATKKFAPPTHDGCQLISFYLMVFRHPAVHDEQAASPKEAIRYGKLFLHHIEPQRLAIEGQLYLASRGRPARAWFEECQETALHINEIRRHMEALLPALSRKRHAGEDPVRKFAALAQEAWAETNGGRFPRSKNPDGPLVKFLGPALAAIGPGPSSAEISDILRGRRRRHGKG